MTNIFGIGDVTADIIGFIGTFCIVGAYAYYNVAKVTNALWFNLVNLIGASLLALSLTVHFNFASLILEGVWALIALFGLVKALRAGPEGRRKVSE